jgi:hypothetical protein
MIHSDTHKQYVQMVIPHADEHKNVVFLQKSILDFAAYKGRTLRELLNYKDPEEACRMVSRDVVKSLKIIPDYVVVIDEADPGKFSCSHTMDGILDAAAAAPRVDFIKEMAEGDEKAHNVLGRHLSDIITDLASKGHLQI